MLKRLYKLMNLIGFYPIIGLNNLRGLKWIRNDEKVLKKMNKENSFSEFPFSTSFPISSDKNAKSGNMTGHYFHQDLLIASRIFDENPKKHIDIGSRIDGFVAHVASFRQIEIIDIRPNESKVENITFIQLNAMETIEEKFKGYTDSISSLHAIEHFGLGRYGDPIDCFGHLKGIYTARDLLSKDGKFYFSVPIGPQRVEFNAHRVFSIRYLLDVLLLDFYLDSFSYVDDKGNLNNNVPLDKENINNNFNCKYGCGIFELTKK